MITFRLKANATFDAENIDDAIWRLEEHFRLISMGIDSQIEDSLINMRGEISIEPIY